MTMSPPSLFLGLHLKKLILEYCQKQNFPVDLKYIDPTYIVRSNDTTRDG